MPTNRPHDAISPATPTDSPESADRLGAGARYRRHLDQFPERPANGALERAVKALIRAAQIRLRSPRKAN
jgi:hypothetical protein